MCVRNTFYLVLWCHKVVKIAIPVYTSAMHNWAFIIYGNYRDGGILLVPMHLILACPLPVAVKWTYGVFQVLHSNSAPFHPNLTPWFLHPLVAINNKCSVSAMAAQCFCDLCENVYMWNLSEIHCNSLDIWCVIIKYLTFKLVPSCKKMPKILCRCYTKKKGWAQLVWIWLCWLHRLYSLKVVVIP